MKTEKTIRRQARETMRGNMSILIAALGMVALCLLLVAYLKDITLFKMGVIDFATGSVNDDNNLILYLVTGGAIAVFLLISPLINGYLKIAANAVQKKENTAGEMFFYFKNAKLYFKTVLYNMLLFMLFFTVSSALNISGYLEAFMPDWYSSELSWNVDSIIKIAAGVVSLFLRLLVYMIFVHYPLMAYALDESKTVFDGVFAMLPFSLKHFGALFKLTLSFMGWFALCFFVVPAIYVIPYFTVASVTSARWLLKADGHGGDL